MAHSTKTRTSISLTLCRQAFGAGQLDMLGVYLQRSWIILLATTFILIFLYIFAYMFLMLIGQQENISRAVGKFALWMIPQLFAYAINFPTAKFLQAQSKIMAMAWISGATLLLHVVFFLFHFSRRIGCKDNMISIESRLRKKIV